MLKRAKERVKHYKAMERAGADDTPKGLSLGGPMVKLVRVFRDGTTTEEYLRETLADWTLATIAQREPKVKRAKIVR